MTDNLYPLWFPDQPGWLILSRPERNTLVMLHRCGLWVEVVNIKLGSDMAKAIRTALVESADVGLTGRHAVLVTRDGTTYTATLEKTP